MVWHFDLHTGLTMLKLNYLYIFLFCFICLPAASGASEQTQLAENESWTIFQKTSPGEGSTLCIIKSKKALTYTVMRPLDLQDFVDRGPAPLRQAKAVLQFELNDQKEEVEIKINTGYHIPVSTRAYFFVAHQVYSSHECPSNQGLQGFPYHNRPMTLGYDGGPEIYTEYRWGPKLAFVKIPYDDFIQLQSKTTFYFGFSLGPSVAGREHLSIDGDFEEAIEIARRECDLINL